MMKTVKAHGTAGWIEDGIMLMNARTNDKTYERGNKRKPGLLVRATGVCGTGLVRHEGLRFGEAEWMGTEETSSVGNAGKKETTIAKRAGRSRWLGRRPKVRGVAMNPVDHPHGGGEGKKSGKGVTPWGKRL